MRSGHTFVASDAFYLNTSMRIYATAKAFLPPVFTLPQGVSSSFYGNVCGIENLLAYGSLTLGLEGFTCNNTAAARYNFTSVIVYASGQLLSGSSSSSNPVFLSGVVCQYTGGSIASVGFNFTQTTTPVTGIYVRS